MSMFNFLRDRDELDTSLFDPEHDMDLVSMLNNARTDAELQSAIRMSRARMRGRRAELQSDQLRQRNAVRPRSGSRFSLLRGI